MFQTQAQLLKELEAEGWLKTPQIIEAFSQIKREDFVLAEDKDQAYLNDVLPLGFGQTISQPLVVAFMLELLQPSPGEKILDVGSGSGWTTALFSYLVKPKGKVIALEIIKELKDFGEKNVKKYNFVKKGIAQFILGDGKLGYAKEAPYDKILVSASSPEVPPELFQQLKIEGKMVLPLQENISLIQKTSQTDYLKKEYPGFIFVPLV
ncbi:MAG: protein-L-isoaspartate(D-aspartate) O-methyltransferase [Patescibacteria group bacterium]|nr:protein-L-isoaspartate(D-aspartate) O-methyltransferase [Patescibacteria group bacterium]